jgi:hypothetical protein
MTVMAVEAAVAVPIVAQRHRCDCGRPSWNYFRARNKWACGYFSTFACVPAVIWSRLDTARIGAAQEEDVNWLRHLVQRWGARHFSLVCPQCRRPASSLVFRRERFKLGDEKLVCEQCGQTSLVTLWRFEGLSCHGDRDGAGRHEFSESPRH